MVFVVVDVMVVKVVRLVLREVNGGVVMLFLSVMSVLKLRLSFGGGK